MDLTHIFSKREEIAYSITHGIGALFSIAALVLLIVFASTHGDALHVISFSLYGATMVILYTASTLVHSFPPGKAKHIFEIFDHSAIYFFIAGTYTPFLLIAIQSALGWTLLGIVWGLAISGTIFKMFFVDRFLHLSTILYIIIGWLIVFAWKPLVAAVPTYGVVFLVIGGIIYSVGTIFYVWRGFTYHHAVWHVFVIAGSVMHFIAVMSLLG
ncbi:PAQR family membrane homeostasis protein TrhA [Aeribacillus pallidus]|uniref:PAQR family membrane homeostasis protein TrhA n=1 Tax=Aeribacillus pallidus TaxID=33936 RepID=UPI000A93AB21|nr:hemolysin III family protein [Aeribacillus pallidus]